MTVLENFFQPWLLFLADDPMLRLMQGGVVLLGVFVVFLVFYTTRDVLLRTESFWFMALCILLVAILPIIGFLIYLLIRPTNTLKQREMETLLSSILSEMGGKKISKPVALKPEKKPKTPEDADLSL